MMFALLLLTSAAHAGIDLNLNHYQLSDTDVNLGGINFRGESHNPDYDKYNGGSPYLDTIYASSLFDTLKKQNPGMQFSHDAKSVEGISRQLSQIFVLKIVGKMLDEEAYLYKQDESVPLERIDYAVRKILYLDSKLMNDAIFDRYIRGLLVDAAKKGQEAVDKLSEVGITDELRMVMGLKDFPKDTDPQKIDRKGMYETFKAVFDRNAMAMVADQNHAAPAGAKLPKYSDLPAAMIARYEDMIAPPTSDKDRFEHLKAKVGTDPYFFAISWTKEGDRDDGDLLLNMRGRLQDPWNPVVIAGQNSRAGLTDEFPRDFEAFYHYIEKKLAPRQIAGIRQKVANTWTFKYWRNRDLLNPKLRDRVPTLKGSIDMFNPMDPIRLNMTSKELAETYDELKHDLAAVPTADFVVTEIKLGAAADTGTANPVSPCAEVFKKAFEGPYKAGQETVLTELDAPDLTTKRYDELVSTARRTIVPAGFDAGAKALKDFRDADGNAACAEYPASITEKTIHFNEKLLERSQDGGATDPDEKERQDFVASLMQNVRLQKMLLPMATRRSRAGNVSHFFFKRRRVLYIPFEDIGAGTAEQLELRKLLGDKFANAVDMVRQNVRSAIVMRRFADRMAEAVRYAIETRYSVRVRGESFSWEGVDGYKINSTVTTPAEWIPQVFVVARPQVNQELMNERRIIERSTKQFEQAFDLP
jgi:hypothetical protein